jgi:hypothetical protein
MHDSPLNNSLASTDVNAKQVGGLHYKGAGYQHWDYAADCKLGYFEGQVTKYLDRHRNKNGLQDVEKAEHFLEKLIALRTADPVYPPIHDGWSNERWWRFRAARPGMGMWENEAMYMVSKWTTRAHLCRALEAVQRVKETYGWRNPNPPESTWPGALSHTQLDAVDDTAGLKAADSEGGEPA